MRVATKIELTVEQRKPLVSAPRRRRVWRAHGLKPHRLKTFNISNDPAFVGLHLNPPEHVVVLSTDEKSQIQALDRTQPSLPLKPGRPKP